MAIEPIKHIYATSLREEIFTDGNSPIKVIGNDYEMYVVKNSKNKIPSNDIINEVLAHYFLNLWNIPNPQIALVKIDPNHLLPEYSNSHQPHFYNKEVFGSKFINAAIDSNILFEIKNKKDYDKFNNPEILFTIGLFDIWIENDDRKPTNHNLLFQTINGKQNIIPIDHSFVFSTLSYEHLDPNQFLPIDNENIFVSTLGTSLLQYKKKSKNWLPIDREKFYLYVENCKKAFYNIVENIPKEWEFAKPHQLKLYNFLFDDDRNKKVYDEFQYKLK